VIFFSKKRLPDFPVFKNLRNKCLLVILAAAFLVLPGSEDLQMQEDTPLQPSVSPDDFSRPLRSFQSAQDTPDFQKAAPETANPDMGISLLNDQDLDRDLVQYYISQYSSPGGLQWLTAVMTRAAPYLGFIKNEISQCGMPAELAYLPVIESGYLAGAVSKSGAMGLWQFMKNSIAPFDIRINEWMDERRDFWKSTDAALRKLGENYNYFKDWPLALAAYNAGLGTISAVVNKTGIRDYWILSQKKLIKTETIHYVPKLLAASYILSNPRKYGIVLWNEEVNWTRIALDRPVDLNILAKEAGISAAELKSANQELTYNITPPDKGYLLKIPQEDADKTAAVLARKDLPLVTYYIHTIKSGDTLLALALYYGITVDQITAMNPGIEPRLLRIGTTLMIPALKDAPPPVKNTNTQTVEFTGTHLVKKGESLWSIALAYGIDPETLAQANGMELNSILREGRVLKTPISE